MLEELKLLLAILIGAAGSGIPLYAQLRKLNLKFKTEENKISSKERINSEAEWKRIIEFRDAELVRLRERDDQQERQLNDLWEKHIACQRSEAAQGERIRSNEERIKYSEEKIRGLEEKLVDLLKVTVTAKIAPNPV